MTLPVLSDSTIQLRSKRAQALVAFVRFAALSGAGWLLDLSVLLTLVAAFGVPAFAANLVSASVAAMSVFLVSRRLVFRGRREAVLLRSMVYLAYTLGVIVASAAALQTLVSWAPVAGIHASATVLAAGAKVLVTPPTLILNFLVAKLVAERGGAQHA